MKKRSLIVFTLCKIFVLTQYSSSLAQGIVAFATKMGQEVDAPVTFTDGRRVTREDGYLAQLFAGRPGTPVSSLQPLPVVVQFSSNPGYVNPTEVEVPGINGQEEALIVMRAFKGPSWEESQCRGESNPVVVQLSTGLQLAAPLIGLQGFQVICIPEPGVVGMVLVGLGSAVLLRKGRKWD